MTEAKTDKKLDNTAQIALDEKSFLNLTPEEMEKKAQIAVAKAIAKTHAKGLPITTVIDGKICKKYPDGTIVPC